jgi:hypothetical protein
MKHPAFNRSGLVLTAVLGALLLAACGGGSDAAAPPVTAEPTEVPSSAAATAQSFTSFAGGLATSETSEPLGVGALGDMPPADDVGEPVELG